MILPDASRLYIERGEEMAISGYYVFPAVRGIQAGKEYYVTMLPLRLIPRLFSASDRHLSPEFRAQRIINKTRIPGIARYIVDHPDSYVFSALTASVDGDIEFLKVSNDPSLYNVGSIRIPLTARFVLNDGQHRRAAIEMAISQRPQLGDETISCVLFQDSGLDRSQQMFADLNRYPVRPAYSISVLYDHRDGLAEISRQLALNTRPFKGYTDMDRSSLSNRSTYIFTLSSIYRATRELLRGHSEDPRRLFMVASDFWQAVADVILPWQWVREGSLRAVGLRNNYVVGHAVFLLALGITGRTLLERCVDDWPIRLENFRTVNWARSNVQQWEGRATLAGRVSIASQHVTLVSEELKRILGITENSVLGTVKS